MRIYAMVLLLALLPGCKSNTAASNLPLREPAWAKSLDTEEIRSGGIQRNEAGDLIYAYGFRETGDGSQQSEIGVRRFAPDGQVLDELLFDDPPHYLPDSSSPAGIQDHARLLQFGNGEFLLISRYGNLYHLAPNGSLISQYDWPDRGYRSVNLVATNSEQACFSGRTADGAHLFCMLPDGQELWQQPVAADSIAQAPYLSAVLLPDGRLVEASIQDEKLQIIGRDVAGNVQWTIQPALSGQASVRAVVDMAAVGGNVVVGYNTQGQNLSKTYGVVHIDAQGVVEMTYGGEEANYENLRIVPYDDSSYLLLLEFWKTTLASTPYADMYRVTQAGEKLWRQRITLGGLAMDPMQLRNLPVTVHDGLISVLQNKKTVTLYSPVVIPVGLFHMIDNYMISRFSGDGKVRGEDVIGRMNYLVDQEGGIFQINQYGYRPDMLVDMGNQFAVAGFDYQQGASGYFKRVPTVAGHILSR